MVQKLRNSDKRLKALIDDVTLSLINSKRYQVPGLGTFSTCTRNATTDRAACKMAMFRACAELRDYASGGPQPNVSGPHAEIVQIIIEAMQCEEGVEIQCFGRMAVVPLPRKSPKLIFHASEELNSALENV